MLTKSDIVYIAGPMTGLPLLNHPAFYAMAGLLEARIGCTVLNPARHALGLEYEEYMTLAMDDLNRATVVVLLHRWSASPGARREYDRAVSRGMEVYHQELVEAWIEQQYKEKQP